MENADTISNLANLVYLIEFGILFPHFGVDIKSSLSLALTSKKIYAGWLKYVKNHYIFRIIRADLDPPEDNREAYLSFSYTLEDISKKYKNIYGLNFTKIRFFCSSLRDSDKFFGNIKHLEFHQCNFMVVDVIKYDTRKFKNYSIKYLQFDWDTFDLCIERDKSSRYEVSDSINRFLDFFQNVENVHIVQPDGKIEEIDKQFYMDKRLWWQPPKTPAKPVTVDIGFI